MRTTLHSAHRNSMQQNKNHTRCIFAYHYKLYRLYHIENVNGKLIIEFFYFQSEFTYITLQSAVCIQIFTQVKSTGLFEIQSFSGTHIHIIWLYII